MFYPGPPPPIANSVQMEKGGELFPTHKTALVQVYNFNFFYFDQISMQAPIDKLDGMVGLEYVVEVWYQFLNQSTNMEIGDACVWWNVAAFS